MSKINCLADLQEASVKDIFNHIKDHLLQQQVPAKDENGFCTFLASNGNRCALGSVMTEEEASYYTATQAFIFEITEVHNLDPKKQRLIDAAVEIHDRKPPEEWESCLLSWEQANLT